MLNTPEPIDSPHDDYLGPWNLHRCDPRHPVIANISAQPVQFVRATYRSPIDRLDRLQMLGTIEPNIEFNLCFCDEPPGPPIEVTLSWFGPESVFEQSWTFSTRSGIGIGIGTRSRFHPGANFGGGAEPC